VVQNKGLTLKWPRKDKLDHSRELLDAMGCVNFWLPRVFLLPSRKRSFLEDNLETLKVYHKGVSNLYPLIMDIQRDVKLRTFARAVRNLTLCQFWAETGIGESLVGETHKS